MSKTTRYFDEQVLRKRPYLSLTLCEFVLIDPVKIMEQSDGRIRHWRLVEVAGEARYLRVVTLDDGQTIHNAFFDRNFRAEVS